MLRILSVLCFSAVALCTMASPVHALIGLNQCGPGTYPPEMRCGRNDLLLGYRDPAGACVWVCCPPNGDARTYNCSGPPTPSDFQLDLRSVEPKAWKGTFTPGPAFESAE